VEQPETYYFEAITRYDKESYREYARYHYRHVAPGLPTLFTVLGGMLVPLGFLGICGLIEINGFLPLLVGTVFLAVGVNLFLGRFAAANVPEPKENRTRFFDDRVEYAGQQEQGFYYYHQVVRLRENGEYFFLYVAKNRAMMVRKSGMTLGTPEQLRGFLHEKVRPQFR